LPRSTRSADTTPGGGRGSTGSTDR
jgi:hypothetical protein